MKEVIFVILEGFADWEGAYIATCLNQGVKPGNPISYKVKTLSITKEPVSSYNCICNRLLLNILQVISQKYGLNL